MTVDVSKELIPTQGGSSTDELAVTAEEAVPTHFTASPEWLGDEAPEAVGLVAGLARLDEEVDDDEFKELSSLASREAARKGVGVLKDASIRLMSVSSHIVYTRGDRTDADWLGSLSAMFRPYFPVTPEGDRAMNAAVGSTASYAGFYTQLRDGSVTLTERLSAEMQDDPSQEYQLLKRLSLVGDGLDKTELEIGDINPRDAYALLLHYEGQTFGVHNLPARLKSKLETGAYDSFIARDIIEQVAEAVVANADSNNYDKMQTMWKYAKELGADDVPDDVLMTRMSQNLSLWPAEGLRALRGMVGYFQDILRTQSRQAVSFIDTMGLTGVESVTEDDLNPAMLHLKADYNKAMGRIYPILGEVNSATQAIINRMEKRRRRRERQLGAQAIDTTAEAIPERQPRELYEIRLNPGNPGGACAIEYRGKDAVEAVIANYLQEHPGAPGLEADVRRILDYASRIDQSRGRNGLKKMHTVSVKSGGEVKKRDVWGFKPKDAVGLPTSCELAKKIRVLVTIEQDSMGIVSLDDKDVFTRTQRNKGFGTQGRAGNS